MFPEQPPDLLWGLHPRQILPSPVRNHLLDLEPFWYSSVPTPESGNTLYPKAELRTYSLSPFSVATTREAIHRYAPKASVRSLSNAAENMNIDQHIKA